jgi:hypothetical protein
VAVDYDGWAIVELERVPTTSGEPLRAALDARRYLEAIGVVPRA